MSEDSNSALAAKIREIEDKWKKALNQELQQKISALKARVEELRKTFKEHS